MDSLTKEELDALLPTEEALGTSPVGPRINGFRFSMERHICGSSNSVAEVRRTSCGALDLELEAEKEVAHESYLARPLTGGKPPPRGH